MNIVYFGTSKFATIILEKLIQSGIRPVAVVTQPDRPAGRAKKLQEPPVKNIAKKYQIPLLQPEKIADRRSQIADLKPDICIVAAYGTIIPKTILEIPKYGFINVHPSLLPKYRGPSPIQTALLNGDKETGASIMVLDEEVDHGPILISQKSKVESRMTMPELEKELAIMSAELLIKTIPAWTEGKIQATPQDHSKATFTKMLTRDDGKIDWLKNAEEIERHIRAYTPWPSAWTMFHEQRLRILAATVLNTSTPHVPGTVTKHNNGFLIACGNRVLAPTLVQLEGKTPMGAEDFLRGHHKILGAQL